MKKALLFCVLFVSINMTHAQLKYFKRYVDEKYKYTYFVKTVDYKLYSSFNKDSTSSHNQLLVKININNGNVLQSFYPIIDSIGNPPRRGAILPNEFKCTIHQGRIYYPALYYYVGTNSLYTSGFFCYDTSGTFIRAKEVAFNYPSTFRRMAPCADGNLFAIGTLSVDTNSSEYLATGLICKLDTAGDKLWEYRRTGPYANLPNGIVAMPDSGMVTAIAAGGWPGLNKAYLLRLNKDGQKIWEKPLPLPTGIWYGAEVIDYDIEHDEFLVYLEQNYKTSSFDSMYLIKVDTNMNVKWQWVHAYSDLNNVGYNGILKVIKDQNGYIAIARGKELTGTWAMGLLKFDKQGKKLWTAVYESKKYGGNIDSSDAVIMNEIDTLNDSGYIIGGTIFLDSIDGNNRVAFIMRIDSTGCLTSSSCESKEWNTVVTYYASPKPKVSVYPNPVADVLHINIEGINNFDDVVIKIYDVLGTQVLESKIHQAKMNLFFTNLQSGIYMYSLEQRGAVLQNGKMVKE